MYMILLIIIQIVLLIISCISFVRNKKNETLIVTVFIIQVFFFGIVLYLKYKVDHPKRRYACSEVVDCVVDSSDPSKMNCKLYDYDYSHFENISCPNQDWNKR